MNALKKYPLLILFAVFLVLFSVTDVIVSRREFSEMENRYLAQRPKFSFGKLWENKYTPEYEKFVNDQFVGRDVWITLKSVSESALGKIENNGIVYGKQGHLFEYYPSYDARRLGMNTGFVETFAQKYGEQSEITLSIIPNSYTVLAEYLPRGLENVDQRAVTDAQYDALRDELQTLDLYPALRSAFEAEPERQLYYRTDHHWTSEGAYLAYQSFAQARGRAYIERAELEGMRMRVLDFYGSYYSKCKLFSAKADQIDVYQIPIDSITIDGEEKSTLHEQEKWQTRDKHAAFLWGNNGVTVLKSQNNRNADDGTSRVLLIKDSYGNPLAPFLTYSYDEVWVVDLRSLPLKMSELMAQTDFDDVWILYNFMSYASDTNFAFMTY